MTREEFLDKTTVANRTITNLQNMIEKVKQSKMEGVQLYIEMNKKFDPGQRVKVYKNNESKTNQNKEFIGFGYINTILVDEDYGIIVYSIKKEDKMTKEKTEEYYYSECASSVEDYEYCGMLIDNV